MQIENQPTLNANANRWHVTGIGYEFDLFVALCLTYLLPSSVQMTTSIQLDRDKETARANFQHSGRRLSPE